MAANESVIIGTDMASPVELNSLTGPLVLDDIAWGIPKKRLHWVEGIQGAVLVDDEVGYDNAEAVASVRVEPQASFDLSRTKHAELVQMLQEAELRGSDGLPCSYTPAEGTTTWLWYLRVGEVDELPVTHESGYFAKSPVLKIRMTRKPALYAAAEVGTVTDDFSTNTIANYTFDTGGGTLSVSGGQLAPSSTAEKALYYSAAALDVADGQATIKLTTGASVAGNWGAGLILRRLDANNFLWLALSFAGASSKLEIYKKDAGAFSAALASGSTFTPTTATNYWLRARADGNILTVELFTSVPTSTSTPAQTATYTLAGADATKFGAGITGDIGLRTNLVPTDYRYDDLSIEPNTWIGSTPVITGSLPAIPGDLPAEMRIQIGDGVASPGQSRRFVEIGLENRHFDESKAANGGVAPPLVLDSDSLVTSGFAGSGTTRAGAYDPGAAGNSVIRATLAGSPVAVCGTGDQPHIGTFRVRGRVWASSSSVRARFAWQDGDGPFRANPYATPAVVGAFARVDLGLITIEKAALGTQRWSGRVEAYGVGGDTIDVDDLELIPAGEGYSTSRVVPLFETPTAFSARDEFAQTAGNLNGKTAPVGGNWATSGVATDFAVSGSGTVTRATTSEGTADRRYAVLDVNLTAVAVEADLSVSAVPGSSLSMGLIARWTDANNHLRIERDVQSSTPALNVFKVVGGVVTALWSFELAIGAPTAGTAWSMRALVDASGRVAVWIDGILVAQAQDPVLATGGTLASGDVGIIDVFTASPAVTRTYDNFLAFVPAADETIFATRSMQLRPDGAKRENAAGTLWGGIQTYRGTPAADFRLPAAGAKVRTSRIAVAVRRNDSETMVDDGLTDSTKIAVFYRQRVLVPR